MTRSSIRTLLDTLSGNDIQILRTIQTYRLITTQQLQRLHFSQPDRSAATAARATTRTLNRLRDLDLVRSLQRRVGGARAGSAGYVWHLGPAGERLLHAIAHDDRNQREATSRGRHGYREPSRYFVDHTLAVTDLAVRATEAASAGAFELLAVQPEPGSWQPSMTPAGTIAQLKPDLLLVTAAGEFEDHWFLEADLATEHAPAILRQSQAYQTHRATGQYQNLHGTYPLVVWVAPDERRATQLRRWITDDPRLDGDLFHVTTTEQFINWLVSRSADTAPMASADNATDPDADATATNEQLGGQEGGNPS